MAPRDDMDRPIPVPENIEAEQALLGAILVNNDAYHRVADFLKPEHFANAAHGRIYAVIGWLIEQKGSVANLVTLKNLFDQDGSLAEIGGALYLARLVDSAVTIINALHYGQEILDLAWRRQGIAAGQEFIQDLLHIDPTRPFAHIGEDHDRRLLEIGEGARDAPKSNALTIRAALAAAEQVHQGRTVGISTGLLDLDSKLAGGLKPGNLIVIAGRPGMGKSALALIMALAAARADKEALFCSLEMSDTELGQRELASETGISVPDQQQGPLSKEQMDKLIAASAVLEALPLTTDDNSGQTVTRIRRRALQQKRKQGLDVIFVDHLHLMQSEGGRTDTRAQQVSTMTAGLKGIAKELDVPLVLLAQLNRNVEGRDNKRAQLSDLRDSGSIEQDADVIIFPYREEYYVKEAEPTRKANQSEAEFSDQHERWREHLTRVRNLAELHVAKQRNGKTGTAKARFDEERIFFENLAKGENT